MLDVKTTGLDTARDEIVELAMVKFTYLADDQIAQITDVLPTTATDYVSLRSFHQNQLGVESIIRNARWDGRRK